MPVPQRKIYYLVSTLGIPNLGDELIAATWLKYLADTAPEADVVVDCINPAAVVLPLAELHPRVRLVSVLWRLCFRYWEHGIGAADRVAAAVTDPEPGELSAELELLRRASVVHLSGGGFLNSFWPAFTGLLSGIAAATSQSGGRSAITGVGLVPGVPGVEDMVAELASRFDVVDVRDEASARLLSGIAGYSCDDAFLGADQWLTRRTAALPEVMVSVQFTLRAGDLFPPTAETTPTTAASGVNKRGIDRLLSFVSKTLAEWGVREVGLVECWPGADQQVLEEAEAQLPVAHRYTLTELIKAGIPAAPGQTWLSTRFHPHLFAAVAGASGVAISIREDYYGTKHASLIAQGSRWSIASCEPFGGRPSAIPERPAAGGFSPDELAALRSAKTRVAESIYGKRN